MEDTVKTPLIPPFLKKYVPFIALGLLIFILYITSNLAGRVPVVESISPNSAFPGAELTIKGRYFGKERNGGRVQISGASLSTDVYQEWKENIIRLTVPEEMNSGLLNVITMSGESKETIPFVNRKQIPVPIIGPQQPGDVYIRKIMPVQGSVGDLVVITGMNFGEERGSSRVFFEWLAGNTRKGMIAPVLSSSLPASSYDLSYETWSDTEIKVRVPDGASSGNLFIATDAGASNAQYFEVKENTGKKRLGQKKIYQVYYWVKIKVLEAEAENTLTVWVPEILDTPDQREVTLITCEPDAPARNENGIMEFSFANMVTDDTTQIKLRFIFTKFETITTIEPGNVRTEYRTGRQLYRKYTRPDAIVPSSDYRIIGLAKQITGKEKNPYLKAQAIYNHVLGWLNYPEHIDFTTHDILTLIDSQKPIGDSFVYTMTFCALLRAAGLPARPIAGYISCADLQSVEHYWAEFYLEDFGWVPVDPILGDGKRFRNFTPEGNARGYYFGNIDNNHITISRGPVEFEQKGVSGRVVTESRFSSFQSHYEESAGKINAYTTTWSSLGIVGVY